MKHVERTADTNLPRRDLVDWEVLADADAEYAKWLDAHREEDLGSLCSEGLCTEGAWPESLTNAA